ncbi:MAG: hypothetical protein S4CHLAM7_12210 [Chlamydiae bacterium]|nr:hypothetical protein [Chlamydiota bacterium]
MSKKSVKNEPQYLEFSTSIFRDNLPLLRKAYPALATVLSLTHLNTLGLKKTKNGEINYRLELDSVSFELHASSPKEESNNQICELGSKPIKRLLYFGVGLGYLIVPALLWLQKDPLRQLVIFEDQIEVLKLLFSSKQGQLLLHHEQIRLIYLNTPNFWESKLSDLQKYLSQPFEIASLASYKKYRHEEFSRFYDSLISLSIDQNTVFAEYLYTSPLVYKNILRNSCNLPHAHNIHSLKNAFKDKPAIICGAGPSLNKNGPLLKELSDRALIFAGGRALSVLNDLHIEPHLAIGIDPYSQHKDTLKCNHFFELPLIYRARMNSDALDLSHNARLYVPGAVGYSFVQWLEKSLGIPSPFLEEGLNVVNFNLQIAKLLGCNPLILVGCDLAYTDQKAYSESIPDEQFLPRANEVDINDLTLNRGYLRKDLNEQPIFTLWKWCEEGKWIEQFASRNPQIKLINATEGGLKLATIENKSLSQAKDDYLVNSFDITGYLHQLLMQTSSFKISSDQLIQPLKLFFLSFCKTSKKLDKLLNILDNSLSSSKAMIALFEQEIKEELVFFHLLTPLEDLFERVEEEKNLRLRKKKKYLFLKTKLEEYRILFDKELRELLIS